MKEMEKRMLPYRIQIKGTIGAPDFSTMGSECTMDEFLDACDEVSWQILHVLDPAWSVEKQSEFSDQVEEARSEGGGKIKVILEDECVDGEWDEFNQLCQWLRNEAVRLEEEGTSAAEVDPYILNHKILSCLVSFPFSSTYFSEREDMFSREFTAKFKEMANNLKELAREELTPEELQRKFKDSSQTLLLRKVVHHKLLKRIKKEYRLSMISQGEDGKPQKEKQTFSNLGLELGVLNPSNVQEGKVEVDEDESVEKQEQDGVDEKENEEVLFFGKHASNLEAQEALWYDQQ
jgi:hypothetical protein